MNCGGVWGDIGEQADQGPHLCVKLIAWRGRQCERARKGAGERRQRSGRQSSPARRHGPEDQSPTAKVEKKPVWKEAGGSAALVETELSKGH